MNAKVLQQLSCCLVCTVKRLASNTRRVSVGEDGTAQEGRSLQTRQMQTVSRKNLILSSLSELYNISNVNHSQLAVGGRCTVGHFCPNGSSVESDCTPGYYCDVDELAEPTGECWAGHFCNSGSSEPNPTDGVQG